MKFETRKSDLRRKHAHVLRTTRSKEYVSMDMLDLTVKNWLVRGLFWRLRNEFNTIVQKL